MVVVAVVRHRDYFADDVSLLLPDGDEPGDVDAEELGIDEADEMLSEFVLLAPLGEVLPETLPLALMDAEVDVSVDGVVVVVVVVLLGEEVSVDAVVVEGDTATVVEPGVALVPELL